MCFLEGQNNLILKISCVPSWKICKLKIFMPDAQKCYVPFHLNGSRSTVLQLLLSSFMNLWCYWLYISCRTLIFRLFLCFLVDIYGSMTTMCYCHITCPVRRSPSQGSTVLVGGRCSIGLFSFLWCHGTAPCIVFYDADLRMGVKGALSQRIGVRILYNFVIFIGL